MNALRELRLVLALAFIGCLHGCATPSAYTYVSQEDMDASWRNVSCSRAETDSQRGVCLSEHEKAGLPAELPEVEPDTQPTLSPPMPEVRSEPKKSEKIDQAQSDQPVRDATKQEIGWIREGMQEKLKDADSAKFRNVKVKGDWVCGEVNSKNSWGAYAGYTMFYAMVWEKVKSAIVFSIDTNDDSYSAKTCAAKGF